MTSVVWLAGTSGVGKTTIGWALAQKLDEQGLSVLFVDADQLRNASGLRATPERLVSDSIDALNQVYSVVNTELIVVAGMADSASHLDDLLPPALRHNALTVFLDADDSDIESRVVGRGRNIALATQSVHYNRAYDAGWVDEVVDTTEYNESEVVQHLITVVNGWLPEALNDYATDVRFPHSSLPVALITGARGVGASTVGFLTFIERAQAGAPVGYLDAHQLALVQKNYRSPALTELRAAAVAAVAEVMGRHGAAEVLVAIDPDAASVLWSQASSPAAYWLDAVSATLESRIRGKALGEGPLLAGNDAVDFDENELTAAIIESQVQADNLDLRIEEALTLSTDRKTPQDIAREIAKDLAGLAQSRDYPDDSDVFPHS